MEETIRIIIDANAPSTTVTKKTQTIQSKCKICGVTTLYMYLGIVACSPCKMFFKRNAENKLVHLKCDFDGHCEINIHNRHICSFCRLKKCFTSGMRTELLRSSLSNKIKTNRKKKEIVESVVTASNALVKVATRNEVQQFSTLNLLQSDQSTLSIDQWNLMSNLVHCYDEHSGYSMAVCYTREQNALPSKARHKVISVNELFTKLTTGAQLLFQKNVDFLSLSSQDRSILLQGKLKYIGGIGTCFLLHQVELFDNPSFYMAAELLYGSESVSAGKITSDHLDYDIVFVKLGLLILAFSTFDYTFYSNTPTINLENTMAVLHIQDMYIELAWRYLVYKYGHSYAVICFSNLIRCIMTANSSISQATERKQYTDMIDGIVKQTKDVLCLND